MGVVTYFLLCGYTPFDRDSQVDEIQAICSADYAFEPEEYWTGVSQTGSPLFSALSRPPL
jgi:calcium/calmodulin-dependent protein kinase I